MFFCEGFRFDGRLGLLVGYHGEPKANLFHNIRIIYNPKRLKVTYSTTRLGVAVIRGVQAAVLSVSLGAAHQTLDAQEGKVLDCISSCLAVGSKDLSRNTRLSRVLFV